MGNSKSNQKKFIIAAFGVAIAGFGIYKIYQHFNRSRRVKSVDTTKGWPNLQPSQQQQNSNIDQQDQRQEDIQVIHRIARELEKFEQDQTPLSIQTIIEVFQCGFQAAEIQFAELLKRNRVERRAVLNDPYQYGQMVIQFNNNLESILEVKQLEVCTKFGIMQKVFESSFLSHLQDQVVYQQIMMSQLQLRQKLIGSIPIKKIMSESDFSQTIAEYMSKLEDVDYFRKYIQHIKQEKEEQTALIVPVLLSDYIYQALGFEEEDITEGVKQYPFMMMEFAQISRKIMELMQRLKE